ncbi:IS6 family transposase [Polycladidibacter hongkongensis]|uniref:IS6 family transposase n=1 Tax=Polycladidibacter hongkongensis TaxID=1647556 RepID=UPI00082F384F|nr:IS6 family transposase [Pseudovibrio hongkongensis]
MLKLNVFPALKGYRFPRSIIGYAVWAYHRFAMSLRDVEDLLAARGIVLSYETIRDWVNKFGHYFSGRIRRDRPAPNDKWHLDECVVKMNGKTYWLWRAVDGNGDTLDILLQSRRNTKAARRFFCKLFKRWGMPRVLVTDKLGSYGAAKREIAPDLEHRQHKGLNNRAEASHRHTRRREKVMGRFKSPRQAQRFLSAHDQVAAIFRPKRNRLSAASSRHARADAFCLWNDYTAELHA